MSGRIVLFGATGYTGRLTAEELVARGAKPVLAARSPQKLEQLAAELGGGLETAAADVGDPGSVAALVGSGDVMLSTVGPFARWGEPAIEAAISAGAGYIDSTGEPSFIRKVFEAYGPRAEQSGSALLTALGYDWVPGNLAGALAIDQAGDRARSVDIGYYMTGKNNADSMSGGTRASALGAIIDPAFAWQGGRIVTERGGKKVRSFEMRGRKRPGISAGSSEHFALPKTYPQLVDVNVYLGWFGPASRPMQAMSAVTSGLTKIPGVADGLKGLTAKAIKGSTGGPDAGARSKSGSEFIAIAYDEARLPLAKVRIEGVNGYSFTAAMLAWGAIEMAGGAVTKTGALGPVEAYGLEQLQQGVASAGLTVL